MGFQEMMTDDSVALIGQWRLDGVLIY